MITYCKKGKRHTIGMNESEFQSFAEVIWLLDRGIPPMGFNRKPLTITQKKVIEDIKNRFGYSDDFASYLNTKTGQ